MDELTKSLVGRTIESVSISIDKEDLMFKFEDGGRALWRAVGDCCSSSWFEHVDDLDFRGEILSVEDDEGRYFDERNDDGALKHYFTVVKTNRGRLIIEMRNQSNGYYGGQIEVYDGQSYMPAPHEWRHVCGFNKYGEEAP
jgi:hypothetical protein